jgi:hypothetical protein
LHHVADFVIGFGGRFAARSYGGGDEEGGEVGDGLEVTDFGETGLEAVASDGGEVGGRGECQGEEGWQL